MEVALPPGPRDHFAPLTQKTTPHREAAALLRATRWPAPSRSPALTRPPDPRTGGIEQSRGNLAITSTVCNSSTRLLPQPPRYARPLRLLRGTYRTLAATDSAVWVLDKSRRASIRITRKLFEVCPYAPDSRSICFITQKARYTRARSVRSRATRAGLKVSACRLTCRSATVRISSPGRVRPSSRAKCCASSGPTHCAHAPVKSADSDDPMPERARTDGRTMTLANVRNCSKERCATSITKSSDMGPIPVFFGSAIKQTSASSRSSVSALCSLSLPHPRARGIAQTVSDFSLGLRFRNPGRHGQAASRPWRSCAYPRACFR